MILNLKHFSFSTDSYGNFDIDRINLSFLNFLEDYKSNKLNINDQVNILKDNSRESYKTLFKLMSE